MEENTPEPSPPAGWYPDAENGGLRWWDGRTSEHRSPNPVTSPAPSVPPRRKMSGFTKFLIAAPFLLVAAGVLGYFNGQRASDPDRNDTDVAAIVACEDAVFKNLEAPATADFSSQAAGGGPLDSNGNGRRGELIWRAGAHQVPVLSGDQRQHRPHHNRVA